MQVDAVDSSAAASGSPSTLLPDQNAAQNHTPQQEEEEEEEPPVASTSTADRGHRLHIRPKDNLLLQLPNESVRLIRLSEYNVVNLGRYGSFLASDLVGHPYGVTLDIVPPGQASVDSRDASEQPPSGTDGNASKAHANAIDTAAQNGLGDKKESASNKGKGRDTANGGKASRGGRNNKHNKVKELSTLRRTTQGFTEEEIVATDATNELIKATGAKTLSTAEIIEMKRQGVSGKEIVERQIAEHEAFALKNEFSKAKYRKVKESKFLKFVIPIPATIHNLCQYYFETDARKIRDLRPDSLAQILSLANIRPGARVLVVDDTSGLLTAAIAERMGGDGMILVLHPNDSPPANVLLPLLNLPEHYTDRQLLRHMHWGLTDDSFEQEDLPIEPEGGEPHSERERNRLRKRKAAQSYIAETLVEWQAGEFDALVTSTMFEPTSILQTVLPALAGSAQIVVHSPVLSVLSQSLQTLLEMPDILNPTITEPFMRQYQVLPGRTHPEMNGIGHGGFLLHAIRVFDDKSAMSSRVSSAGRKRLKRG